MDITDEKILCKGRTCKNKLLNISSALKHIIKSVECKKEYSDEEIQAIRSLSQKRTKQKALERQKLNYDADTRCEKHKQSYNPLKRKAKYEKEKGINDKSRETKVTEIADEIKLEN